jgi:predicted dinucleotide-binding enzyme
MNIGIFGTGSVGQVIGSRLVDLGHSVMMGSRTHDNEKARAWKRTNGDLASFGTYAEAAAFGEVLFNCTAGRGTLSALEFPKASDLQNKILIDIANPLDYTRGAPPTLSVANTDSLAEQIQREHPLMRVVKALNMMNVEVMVHPEKLSAAHDIFVCGNDRDAKATVTMILMEWFGWKSVIDLGDITQARGMELFLPLWLSIQRKLGTSSFNIKLVK